MPFHVRVAAEGVAHASVHGHGGGGVCEHGVCPPSLAVGGTERWALRGECEARGILPSEPKHRGTNTYQLLFHDRFPHACNSLIEIFVYT